MLAVCYVMCDAMLWLTHAHCLLAVISFSLPFLLCSWGSITAQNQSYNQCTTVTMKLLPSAMTHSGAFAVIATTALMLSSPASASAMPDENSDPHMMASSSLSSSSSSNQDGNDMMMTTAALRGFATPKMGLPTGWKRQEQQQQSSMVIGPADMPSFRASSGNPSRKEQQSKATSFVSIKSSSNDADEPIQQAAQVNKNVPLTAPATRKNTVPDMDENYRRLAFFH